MYVDLPLGWRRLNGCGIKEKFKENHVLKLNRSVYGLKQSPKNFFKLLKGNLEKCGFHQSDFDSCLFISDKVICVCYVDDCLFFAPEESDIDAVIDGIKKCNMDLQVEDSVAGFLGVHIDRKMVTNDDGTEEEKVTLLQTGLTDHIISALGLNEKATRVKLLPLLILSRKISTESPSIMHLTMQASLVCVCIYAITLARTLASQ